MTDPHSTELAKQGIKATVEGILAPYKDLIARALGPFADQIGGIASLYGRQWRLEREAAFWEKFKDIVERIGRKPNPIPPKIFFPFLHQAVLEDDEDLQRRWAALMATATTDPDAYRPIFSDILRTFTAVEVRLLDALYADFVAYYKDRYEGAMPIDSAVEHVRIGDEESAADHLISLGYLEAESWQDLFTHGGGLKTETVFSDMAKLRFVLDSLMRNQLVRPGESQGRSALRLTVLGLRFLKACSADAT